MAWPKSIVVLVIDRLGAAWLGPCGNTWLDTPNFNRLATRAGLFGAACEWVAAPQRPNVIWLHWRGMSGPWDAPLEMRYHFADEDDPDPPTFVVPPEKTMGVEVDPDEVLGFVQAYAAQIQVADLC